MEEGKHLEDLQENGTIWEATTGGPEGQNGLDDPCAFQIRETMDHEGGG